MAADGTGAGAAKIGPYIKDSTPRDGDLSAAAADISLAGGKAQEVYERDRDLLIVCSGRETRSRSMMRTAPAGCGSGDGGTAAGQGLNDAALACLDLVRRYGERWTAHSGPAVPAGSWRSSGSARTSKIRPGPTRTRCWPSIRIRR